MALINNIRGVLVEKYDKEFEDGTKGAYCQIVNEEGNLIPFWVREQDLPLIGETLDVDGYVQARSRMFSLRAKEWNGKTKYTLDHVGS